jgi:Xaa-Pro aminopeptidase
MSPTQTRAAEVAEKLERVRAYLADGDRSGVLLTRQFLVSWITAGMEDTVLRGQDPAFLSALVTADGTYLVTSNIEARRLEGEEHPDEVGFEVVEVPWYEGHFHTALDDLVDVSKLANDGYGPGEDRSDELQELRIRLTAGETDRMRELAADGCNALEAAVRTLRPGMTGREMAAELSSRLEVDGIFPYAIFAGGDHRRLSYRHPNVSAAPFERDALVVIVGVRGGLNMAATRTVSIGEPDPDLAKRHLIAAEAEAAAITATRPGNTYGQALQAQLDVYEARGYHDEWRNHTQGGPIGYGAREFGPGPLAAPDRFTEWPVEVGHAVAWNPTVQGAKAEDTFLVGESENEMVSNSTSWPMVEVEVDGQAFTRPAILRVG